MNEVDQQNQPVTGMGYYRNIVGEPRRYKLHLAANKRYKITLTVGNSCNGSISTKYINTFCPYAARPVDTATSYALFPNPATEQFTVRSNNPLSSEPIVRNTFGEIVAIQQLAVRQDDGVWYTTYSLRVSLAGLYLVELGAGKSRFVKQLVIQ